MKVYIAAPYPLRDDAIALMAEIESAGAVVTSSWLRHHDELTDHFARVDLADVAGADVLVAWNPAGWKDTGTGGRHVEFGYAIALGKHIVLLGPPSNIFHHLSDVIRVETRESLLAVLAAMAPSPQTPYQAAVGDTMAELMRAEGKFKPFNSHHEGYAVIKEEVDELWDAIKANNKQHALREAVQVAAMGLRFIVNLGSQRS